MDNRKKIIGILGGIGSGKSSVAGEFGRLGCGVIDADRIAHELLEKDEIIDRLKEAFGEGILDSNGKIQRGRLSEVVFEDQANVTKINEIIHPQVIAKAQEQIVEFNIQDKIKAIVLDAPLLVEVGWHKRCDKLVFVACKDQIRAHRNQKKGAFSIKQQKKRENFQISLDNKAKIADYIVDNNSDLSALSKQIVMIFSIIIGES